jgi:hypothetical protein
MSLAGRAAKNGSSTCTGHFVKIGSINELPFHGVMEDLKTRSASGRRRATLYNNGVAGAARRTRAQRSVSVFSAVLLPVRR